MICPLPSLFSSHNRNIVITLHWLEICRGKQSNNCLWNTNPHHHHHHHNSVLIFWHCAIINIILCWQEWQPHLMLISRLVNGNILRESQQLRGAKRLIYPRPGRLHWQTFISQTKIYRKVVTFPFSRGESSGLDCRVYWKANKRA